MLGNIGLHRHMSTTDVGTLYRLHILCCRENKKLEVGSIRYTMEEVYPLTKLHLI